MNSGDAQQVLSEVLGQFDSEEPERLARQLVKRLKLNKCSAPYESYSVQVRRLLARNLTLEEEFQLDHLYRVLCIQDGARPEDIAGDELDNGA
jgi:hypothetical protein